MKLSNYNFFYNFDAGQGNDDYLIYNSRTNALAVLEEDNYKALKAFERGEKALVDEEFIQGLLQGGYVVDKHIDELALLKHNMLMNRYSKEILFLTIAPTMQCNFACTYCYEKNSDKAGIMQEEVKEKIVQLVENQIEDIKELVITWYGGEPTLALDTIYELSEKLSKLCEANHVKYFASIVTNGYNLSTEIAEKLNEHHVKHMQITLDGPPDIHDSRRFLHNGSKTFERIVNNVVECVDIIEGISVRINVDQHNIDRAKELIAIFDKHGIRDKVYLYLGYVESINGCYNSANCNSFKEFSKKKFQFDENFLEDASGDDAMKFYPSLKANACTADDANSYVIAPDGKAYKCWSDIGIEEYVVQDLLKDDTGLFGKRYWEYIMYDPTHDERCKTCKVLPLCMGGCPYKRVMKNQERCNEYKHSLDEYLQKIAEKIYKDSLLEQSS